MELSVPWEDSVDKAHERKHLRYAELAADAQHRGWNTEVRPVEGGVYLPQVGFINIYHKTDLGIRRPGACS